MEDSNAGGERPASASQIILLVENDLSIRADTTELLRDRGYTVIEAEHGATALHQMESVDRIDLLFVDAGLPKLDGPEIVAKVIAKHPGLKLLFAVSYEKTVTDHDGQIDPNVQVILKPYTAVELARRIRNFLLGRGSGFTV